MHVEPSAALRMLREDAHYRSSLALAPVAKEYTRVCPLPAVAA